MADIIKVCAHCGTELKVSEYADLSSMACPSCGNSLADVAETEEEQDDHAEPAAETPHLKFRKNTAASGPVAENAAALQDAEKSLVNDWISIILGPDRWMTLKPVVPWLTFLILLYGVGLVIRLRSDLIVRWLLGMG